MVFTISTPLTPSHTMWSDVNSESYPIQDEPVRSDRLVYDWLHAASYGGQESTDD